MKNKRIRKMIALGVLSTTLIMGNVVVYAEDATPTEQTSENPSEDPSEGGQESEGEQEGEPQEQTQEPESSPEQNDPPQAPDKPNPPQNDASNEQIENYNKEVDNYNQQVDGYNEQAADYNKKIDDQYNEDAATAAAQNEAIDAHNKSEDEKAQKIKDDNAAAQASYDKEYEQYEKDKTKYDNIENQIINDLHYESVEAYNETINDYYNTPIEEGLEKNAKEENTFNIEDSYSVVPDAASEGDTSEKKTYDVQVIHNFEGYDSYEDSFQIKEDEILTLNPAGALLETFTNRFHIGFFAKTDDDHLSGYWRNNGDVLYSLCNYLEKSWNNGTVYTLSYKDGERTTGDTAIKMVYNYAWVALTKHKTYTKPEEPKLELQEEYTPQYEERVPDPEKKPYAEILSYLDKMPLKEEAKAEDPKSEEKTETKEEKKCEKHEDKKEESAEAPVAISEDPIEHRVVEPVVIEDEPTPSAPSMLPQTGDTKAIIKILIVIACAALGIWFVLIGIEHLKK
jgi:hypothetical protein